MARWVIAADHAGYQLKDAMGEVLKGLGQTVTDLGTNAPDSVDYPDYAHAAAEKVLANEADFALLVCGTGVGISISANRHKGIRAALCTDSFTARATREHNDANVLCLGGRVVGVGLAEEIVRAFVGATFAGGRHQKRVEKIER